MAISPFGTTNLSPISPGRLDLGETTIVGGEHFDLVDPFVNSVHPLIEDSSISSTSNAIRKIVRLSGTTMNYLVNSVENIMQLPLWNNINRIVLQCLVIDSECNVGFHNHSTIYNVETYMGILRNLRTTRGIEIYVGMAFPPKYVTQENLPAPHIMAISLRPKKFWLSIDKFLFKNGFDGIELDFQEYAPICRVIYESIHECAYRSHVLLCLPQSEPFIHYYGSQLRAISELCEGLIVNSYGHFKYRTFMLARSERSYEDLVNLVSAYMENGVKCWNLFMVLDTSAVVYSIDEQLDPTMVDSYSVISVEQVERLRRDNESRGCLEWIDREKLGSLIIIPDDAHESTRLVISWDNPKMVKAKVMYCGEQGLRGIIVNDLKDDLPYGSEQAILTQVNKFI